MIKRGTQFFVTLMLILMAAGCTPVETSEQAAADSTPVGEFEQIVADSRAVEGSEQATAASTPVDTVEQAAPVNTAVAEPEQTATVSTPVDTLEPMSGYEAGQIYAAAIRQMYTIDFSFGEPGEPPEFPLVYIVSTTDDGTLLYAPATPAQKLAPKLRQAIEAELADMLFEIIWVESFDEAPVGSSNGMIAEGQGIVITMGNILPQEDGTVHLPFYMLCGSLCLSGKTYVLEEVDGGWQVTGSVGAEIEG